MREKGKTKLDEAMEAVSEAARKLSDPNKPAVAEDAFALPPKKAKHQEPPKDPNPPSGSLSADDAEAISGDSSIPPKPRT